MKQPNYIYTPVTLITGSDAKGNEYAYAKSAFVPAGWIDLYNECNTTPRYIANVIIPATIKVRFGNLEMTRQEWEANGCPFELSAEQMQAAQAKLETETDARIMGQVAAELVTQDLSASHKTMSVMPEDLGTHATISGGDVIEFGSPQWYASIKPIEF